MDIFNGLIGVCHWKSAEKFHKISGKNKQFECQKNEFRGGRVASISPCWARCLRWRHGQLPEVSLGALRALALAGVQASVQLARWRGARAFSFLGRVLVRIEK